MRLVANLVRGFFRFWYDFIVGDCWEIAAGVVVVLLASILLMRGRVVSCPVLSFAMAGAIMSLLVLSTFLELYRKRAANNP
jgi:hypothetical protein